MLAVSRAVERVGHGVKRFERAARFMSQSVEGIIAMAFEFDSDQCRRGDLVHDLSVIFATA